METILLDDNRQERDYTGVSKFHKAGYFGERVVAASGEYWALEAYNPGGQVLDPLGIGTDSDTHAINTAATFFQVAPKAKLYMLPSNKGVFRGDGTYTSDFLEKSAALIEKYNVTNMFVSKSASRHTAFFRDLSQWLRGHGDFKYYFAAGNYDTEKYNEMIEIDEITGVAAYHINDDGEAIRAGYSSESEYVDFAAPSSIYLNIHATSPKDSKGLPKTGTSFATPWLCGMAVLVDDYFIDKTGKPLSREAMLRFFRDHCRDIYLPGKDVKTGYGAVYLPDPAEIDIAKYTDCSPLDKPDKPVNPPDISEDWAKADIEWAVQNKILFGDGNGNYQLDRACTRREMVAFLHRLYKLVKN